MEGRSRGWCYTCFDIEYCPDALPESSSYLIQGFEVCPTTSRPHLQGFIYFPNAVRFSTVQALLPPGSHLAVARGTPSHNRDYCSKDGDFLELGAVPAQGSRSDLLAVKASIDSGVSVPDLWQKHFSNMVRYNRAFKEYKRVSTPPRNARPDIFCLIGPSRSGKTSCAHAMAGPSCYVHSLGKWWDDYDGESVVLFDEFYGSSCPFTQLLKILDWYPLRVETKGGSVQLLASTFIFTSNQDPQDWYSAERTHQGVWSENPLKCRLDEFGEIIYFGGFVRTVPEILPGQFGFPIRH